MFFRRFGRRLTGKDDTRADGGGRCQRARQKSPSGQIRFRGEGGFLFKSDCADGADLRTFQASDTAFVVQSRVIGIDATGRADGNALAALYAFVGQA